MLNVKSLQELSPKWAHFCLGVERFIFKELKVDLTEKRLVLGVSGGPDSTALLIIFFLLRHRLNVELLVAHLNHGIREESAKETNFVVSLCKGLNIPIFVGKSNAVIFSKKKKVGLEEGARILRYKFFQGILRKKGYDFILLGHQLNDLAEDVLLRLIRGTFWPGVGGMNGYDKDRKIIRPLLFVPKKKLMDFLTYTGVGWVEDRSNWDLRYKRNRVRHKILPILQEENPKFLEVIKKMWILSRIDKQYWEGIISELGSKEQIQEKIFLKIEDLLNLPKSIRLRWYKDVLDRLGKGEVLTNTLIELDRALNNFTSIKIFQFPGDKIVKLSPEGIYFYKKE